MPSTFAARHRRSSSLLHPGLIPGLRAYFRADLGTFQDSGFLTAAASDGDPVGGWQDQSANGWHASQATASARPTLRYDSGLGRWFVRFDGVDDFLALSGAGNILRNVGFGAGVAILRSQSGTGSGTFAGISTTATTTTRFGVSLSPGGTFAFSGRRLDADTLTSAGSVGGAAAVRYLLIVVADYAAAASYGFRSGTQVFSALPWLTAGTTSDTDSASVNLGSGPGLTGANFFNGDIYEWAIYANDRAILSLRARLEQYAARVYGI